MKTFIIFVILNIVNVIIQTSKSIVTIKCGKVVSALVNAVAYGLYTVVIVWTMADIALWLKAVVVAVANLIGVFVVKLIEEKTEKTKLWKVEAAIPTAKEGKFIDSLKSTTVEVPFNCVKVGGGYTIFNIFCYTKEQSTSVKTLLKMYNAKFFVSESKKL